MYGYNSTPTSISEKPQFAGKSRYPMYYPHPHLVPPLPRQRHDPNTAKTATRIDTTWNGYSRTYPANTTFLPESIKKEVVGILRAPSRNQTSSALADARSGTPTRDPRSKSIHRRRVSFADGSKPGSAENPSSVFTEKDLSRRHRSYSSFSKRKPSSNSKRHSSRIAEHHYNLGVPVDRYVNVRSFIPFLPNLPAARISRRRQENESRNSNRQYVPRRSDGRPRSRPSKFSTNNIRTHWPNYRVTIFATSIFLYRAWKILVSFFSLHTFSDSLDIWIIGAKPMVYSWSLRFLTPSSKSLSSV